MIPLAYDSESGVVVSRSAASQFSRGKRAVGMGCRSRGPPRATAVHGIEGDNICVDGRFCSMKNGQIVPKSNGRSKKKKIFSTM